MGYEIQKKGHKAVFGIFRDRASLDRAVDSLRAHGFRNSDVSVLMQSENTYGKVVHGVLTVDADYMRSTLCSS
jgi:hypothetical protein